METKELSIGTFIAFLLIGLLSFALWGCPKYKVYSYDHSGKAQLIEAEHTKRVRIEEAKAKLEAAALEAKAEVERAKGVAEANKIIAESLGGAEGYLRWRYINMLEESTTKPNREIIYLPTEAGIPIWKPVSDRKE